MYYANTGAQSATDSTLRLLAKTTIAYHAGCGVYVGGPIIQDKLFMFLSAENDQTKTDWRRVNGVRISTTRHGWINSARKVDRYIASSTGTSPTTTASNSAIGDDARPTIRPTAATITRATAPSPAPQRRRVDAHGRINVADNGAEVRS